VGRDAYLRRSPYVASLSLDSLPENWLCDAQPFDCTSFALHSPYAGNTTGFCRGTSAFAFSLLVLLFLPHRGGDWAGDATWAAMGHLGDWRNAVMDPTTYEGAAFEVNYVKVWNKTS
jgi:hypothetical protein